MTEPKQTYNGDESQDDEFMVREEGARRNFFMVPNLVDALPLSPIAFRVYCHFKKVCGESGWCKQSLATIAKTCRVSRTSVSDAKDELVYFKLIVIKQGRRLLHECDIITIIDIWNKTLRSFPDVPFGSELPDNATSDTVDEIVEAEDNETSDEASERVDTLNCSPSGLPKFAQWTSEVRPVDLKKTQDTKKTQYTPRGKKRHSESTDGETAKPNLTYPMMQVLAEVTQEDLALNRGKISSNAKRLVTAGYTPEQVKAIYTANGKWYTDDWRGKNAQPPTIATINETVARLAASGNTPPPCAPPPSEGALELRRKMAETQAVLKAMYAKQ